MILDANFRTLLELLLVRCCAGVSTTTTSTARSFPPPASRLLPTHQQAASPTLSPTSLLLPVHLLLPSPAHQHAASPTTNKPTSPPSPSFPPPVSLIPPLTSKPTSPLPYSPASRLPHHQQAADYFHRPPTTNKPTSPPPQTSHWHCSPSRCSSHCRLPSHLPMPPARTPRMDPDAGWPACSATLPCTTPVDSSDRRQRAGSTPCSPRSRGGLVEIVGEDTSTKQSSPRRYVKTIVFTTTRISRRWCVCNSARGSSS